MSYTPEDQLFEKPIEKLLEGIKEFDEVVDKRFESNDWSEDHIKTIEELSLDLKRIRRRLHKLKNETR